MANNALAPAPSNHLGGLPTFAEKFAKSRDTSWADKFGGVTPFYPQQRYIDKNLAPELGITNVQLEALAAANQQALRSGLMSPTLASKMLPTLLTENATGIKSWGYADLPKYRAILEKAGLPSTVTEINDAMSNAKTDFDRTLIESKLMHAMMAAKASIYGEDKAIERWNGMGVNKAGYANASNHARKVAELEQLLQHPSNKPMMDQWGAMKARYEGAGPQQVTENMTELPSSNWTDVIPSNVLGTIQRNVRNWTAP